jgi:hypothetical protein
MGEKRDQRAYAVVDREIGGLDYRRITDRMESLGYDMRKARVHSEFFAALRAIASRVCRDYGEDISIERADIIARNPLFHSVVSQAIRSRRQSS